MAKEINKLYNCNIYLEDKSLAGKADEITLPVLKYMQLDHKPLGAVGTAKYPAGIDAMEVDIKWNSFYKDVFATIANPYKGLRVMVRSSVDVYQGDDRTAQKKYIVYMNLKSSEVPLGSFKKDDNTEFPSKFSCNYCKLEYDGSTVLEFDAENDILIIDGVDVMKEWRTNLGI